MYIVVRYAVVCNTPLLRPLSASAVPLGALALASRRIVGYLYNFACSCRAVLFAWSLCGWRGATAVHLQLYTEYTTAVPYSRALTQKSDVVYLLQSIIVYTTQYKCTHHTTGVD